MTKLLALALLACCLASPGMAADNSPPGKLKSIACRGCHGAQGISSNPEFPHLAGQTKGYLIKTLHEFRSGERQDATMNRIAGKLSDTDINELSHYYSKLPR